MMEEIRFLWNATRGHRFRPWKSEYIRWRIETYSGWHADEINASRFFRFLAQEKLRLIRFLLWTGNMSRKSRRSRIRQ